MTNQLSGTATLLVGGPGAGKTYSLASFAKAGIETFCVFTEPGGEESLLQAAKDHDIPVDLLHWRYIPPAAASFAAMVKSAQLISQYSYQGLTELKSGIEKAGYRQFITMLETLADFKCERTGESYGSVDSWGPDRAICLDSLSGINIMAMDMVVGSKPVKHQGEWGVAMDAEERLIQKLCSDIRAFFVLIAHAERETNELTGVQQIMAGALGRKLAPRIPRFFSDVIHSYREGGDFYWSTVSMNVDLKARTVPLQDKMPPDFGMIVDSWRARNEAALSTPENTSESAEQEDGQSGAATPHPAASPAPAPS